MSTIGTEQVKELAALARLRLTAEEVNDYEQQLNAMLAYVHKLNEVDTSNVAPTSHILAVTDVVRADEVQPSLSIEEALQNAPAHRDGQFEVPAVLGGE